MTALYKSRIKIFCDMTPIFGTYESLFPRSLPCFSGYHMCLPKRRGVMMCVLIDYTNIRLILDLPCSWFTILMLWPYPHVVSNLHGIKSTKSCYSYYVHKMAAPYLVSKINKDFPLDNSDFSCHYFQMFVWMFIFISLLIIQILHFVSVSILSALHLNISVSCILLLLPIFTTPKWIFCQLIVWEILIIKIINEDLIYHFKLEYIAQHEYIQFRQKTQLLSHRRKPGEPLRTSKRIRQ